MFNQGNNDAFKVKVNSLMDEVASDDIDDTEESLQTRYNKKEMFDAIKQLTSNNKELLKSRKKNINGTGENMDDKDMKILTNSIEKILEDKFDKKFSGLENNLKNIEDSVAQTCKDGKCFTGTLEGLNEKLSEIDSVKTEVAELKSGVNTEIGNVTDSISKMTEDFTSSISKMNEKLGDTCTGIDCINKRFAEEDDMVECPNEDCKHIFSLSSNIVGDTVVCPKCGSISNLE